MHLSFSYIIVDSSKFVNMIAINGKGLLNIEEYSEAHIINSYFENMTSKVGSLLFMRFNGDNLIYFKNNSFVNNINTLAEEMFCILTSNNIIFENNSFEMSSTRAFFVINSSIILKNNFFSSISCFSLIQPGCIINLNQYSILIVDNIKIFNITSSADAVIVYSSNSMIELNNSMILMINSFSNQNFLFVNYQSNIIIFNSSFDNFSFGGFHLLNSSYLLFSHSNFSKRNYLNNEISSPILYSENTQYVLIKFSNFFDNFGSQNGSAINLQCSKLNSQQSHIYFSNFIRNKVNSNGGAIYVKECH